MGASVSDPTIFSTRPSPREGESLPAWIHFAIVSHECIVWIECTPALWSGWNVARVWTDGPEEWPNMSAMQIIAWKQTQHSNQYCCPFVSATEGECAMLDRMFATL
jgi:hypothetical protein